MDNFVIKLKADIAKARAIEYLNRIAINKKINFDDHGVYEIWFKRQHELSIELNNKLKGGK